MSAHEDLAKMEGAARECEKAERRRAVLDALDGIVELAEILPEDLIGTQNMLAKYQIFGVCLAAKASMKKEK